ncbi:MAG: MGMT family protein [Candidatus Dormibacteria bacterium]
MVVRVLLETSPGDVLSYGDVARLAGHPGAARAVGRVLATSSGLPWWRVVTASGRLVPGMEAEQARRLEQEVCGGLEQVRRPGDGAAGPGPAWPSPGNARADRARQRRFPP